MNISRVPLWIVVLGLLFFPLINASELSSINVRVLDARTGEPVPNEKVAVFIEGGKNAKDYQTDARGEFKLEIDLSARIYAATEWRVSCTPVKAGNVPYVPVSEIIQEGFTYENACGNARTEVIRDKLVIFARKASFFEKFRR